MSASSTVIPFFARTIWPTMSVPENSAVIVGVGSRIVCAVGCTGFSVGLAVVTGCLVGCVSWGFTEGSNDACSVVGGVGSAEFVAGSVWVVWGSGRKAFSKHPDDKSATIARNRMIFFIVFRSLASGVGLWFIECRPCF